MMLRRRRFERGALELTMPEIKIELDAEGRVSGARVTENTESHQIIEEFMLAANEAVAERLASRRLHFLRRIHANPTPRKLKALTEFVNELGFKTESLESRFELQKLLTASSAGPSNTPSISRCCGRCNGRSTGRRSRATTRWPASATATSRRRFAAIPT